MQVFTIRLARVAALILVAASLAAPSAHAQTALKVLDWNTHHGVGTDGVYNLQRFIPFIAKSGANVVSLNEVEKFTSWGNEDQPARYAALLKIATGKTWYHTFAQRDGAAKGQGNLILSTFPIEAAGSDTLSYSRSVARAQIVVNGIRVNVFSTHLDADSSTRRTLQMTELRAWAANFSQPHVFAGDFNAWPGAAEIATMTGFAKDAWATAKTNGTAVAYAGNEAGNTRNSRIDYIWYPKTAGPLVLKSAQVFDTRNGSGTMPSDHRPVMATFQVGTAAVTGSSVAIVTTAKVRADFDGDKKSDLSVYRPHTGEWFVSRSGGSGMLQAVWGAPSLGDVPVAGDYDGDGRQDMAVFRTTNATWYTRATASGAGRSIQWGTWGDVPVAGDYDGDGRTDTAVYRPGNGTWYVRLASTGAGSSGQWGTAGDIPVPGDYDGDRKGDLAVFRPSTGTWYVRYSSNGSGAAYQWGAKGDVPVAGDYDGDGRTDCAVFRPSTATWYLRYATGAAAGLQWGMGLDVPVPGDYDGDGKTDIAVFRPSDAVWHLRSSTTGSTSARQWGGGQDLPIPSR
jgi:endonuclease/exonuclease/phosphatase family metal-dependent hydrolase